MTGSVVAEKLGPAKIAHVASLLNHYVPKKKGQEGMSIEAWLSSTRTTLSSQHVPSNQWVIIARTRMPEQEQNDYNAWIRTNHDGKQTWETFREFMLKRFTGAVSDIDAYCQLKRMRLPTHEKDLEAVMARIETLCELTEFKPVAEFKAIQFISMMPTALMIQAFGRDGSARSMKTDEIKTLIQTYYQSRINYSCNAKHSQQ
ncbi:hypothetical protein GGI03_001178 [Coemansia sp. RSA 2337]|nr:hypothetical protein H4S03_008029 [Coemansia sp. S3946]KAJ2052548.1 hypothetical protein H4S04_001272 [Coemansia sp. S16]KAJ2054603.1 hypothetical protein GGI08_004508 [Coemansia sp. S2]KAJ2075963.1 hypothetical protein GGH13_000226 [Coemansia sp. S155-1]KAJ2117429.1 hypothetical protein IW146_000752 [Coemansia sp. RSA 922]KAJ2431677.1 hypothetical protein GGF41_000433 [Coemansia sp. RSA 2531]KAJ2468126.1 hypothetical protein GGI03_001178 [Coemansia sp. RSA 2337]